jgi:urease accessory protein
MAPDLPTVAVHLVNAAAGPLAGDELHLDITVGAGVRLVLGSAAATVALPGRGEGPSVLRLTVDVADGGALDMLPEPTVAARGCRHRIEAEVTLGARAFLRWREEILLGRFGEPAGSVSTSLRVDVVTDPDSAAYTAISGEQPPGPPRSAPGVPVRSEKPIREEPRARGLMIGPPSAEGHDRAALGPLGDPVHLSGTVDAGRTVVGSGGSGGSGRQQDPVAGRPPRRRPLLRQELDLSPDAPGLHGPAVLGGARAVGSLLVAAPGPDGLGYEPVGGDGVALLPLAGPGVLVSALADDAVTLRRRLTAAPLMPS